MAAWRRHPDTFFGVVGQRTAKAESPLELYDIIHEWFKREPRERLLEAMADAPDRERLAALDQPQLASIYAERMTLAAFTARLPASNALAELKIADSDTAHRDRPDGSDAPQPSLPPSSE
jgi:hypothetical protein